MRKFILPSAIIAFLLLATTASAAEYICKCDGEDTEFTPDFETCVSTCWTVCTGYNKDTKSASCKEIKDSGAGASSVKSKEGCETKNGQTVCTLPNPLTSKTTDAAEIIGIIIKGVLGVIGALTLFMVFWGATGWIFAAGNPEKIKASTSTLFWAIIGLLIIFASYMFLGGWLGNLFGGK